MLPNATAALLQPLDVVVLLLLQLVIQYTCFPEGAAGVGEVAEALLLLQLMIQYTCFPQGAASVGEVAEVMRCSVSQYFVPVDQLAGLRERLVQHNRAIS